MNLLHDIDPGTKEEMNVIIEIPKGSHNKYEIDKATGVIKLDRVLHSAQDYPFDYGFVPQTLWDDGDALDVVLLTTHPLAPSILVEARPIGIMHMTDGGDADEDVVDAGLGAPSHAAAAMEMGADAVLVNTAIAVAADPVIMAQAFAAAVEVGRVAREMGLGTVSTTAQPTSPLTTFLE